MKHVTILPALLVFAMLAGCGDAQTTTDTAAVDTAANNAAEAVTDAVTDTGYPAPDTSNLDFGGAEIRVMLPNFIEFAEFYAADTLTGESVEDASYLRRVNVQEALNVQLVMQHDNDGMDGFNIVSKSIAAGDDAYDIVFTHPIKGLSEYVIQNMLYTLDDLPHVDLDAPWWNKEVIDIFRIGQKTFYGFGDIIASSPGAVFFNKDISEEYDLPDHYQTVRDGKWTYDYFLSEAKMISQDLNGDSKIDANDKTGYAGDLTEMLGQIPFACGINLVTTTENGLEMSFMSEKLIDVFEKT